MLFSTLHAQILEHLTHNAVLEKRFNDAAYYFYQLSMETLRAISSPPHSMVAEDRVRLERFSELYDKAEIYYAYGLVHEVWMSLPWRSCGGSCCMKARCAMLCLWAPLLA